MNDKNEVSIGSWIFTFIMLAIPIVNIIYILGCLFGFAKRPKVTLVRATFIVSLISLVVCFIFINYVIGNNEQILNQISEILTTLLDKINQTINSLTQ